jgi:gliding motility-associated-like protein
MERILRPSTLMRMRYITSMLLILFFTGFCTIVRAQKATITTDKDDYWPGELVIITGTGWQNYDSVQLTLTHLDPLPDPYHAHTPWFVNPDADGKIYYKWFVLDQELGTSFELGALGFAQGIPASDYAVTYFMDASITNVTVNGSSFCDGQPVNVSYTISNTGGSFGSNNSFTAQLSDASGSFSSPVIIGTLNSVKSGVINAIIPSGTADGTHYRIRVISSNPVITSNPNATNLTINVSPTAPTIGIITQPTCATSTGSVVLNGLPATETWTLTRTPGGTTTTGTGASKTISGLGAGTYTYTVTNASGCISTASANVVINTQPATPIVPNQTASISSGATFTVTPGGGTIPVGTTYTWTAPTYTGGVTGGSAQTVPQINISGTLTIPSGSGTATFTVTPTSGICVGATFTVTVTVISTCVAVTIGTQPTDNIMCATSGNASFTVVASGATPFTYQWQYYNSRIWAAVINGTPAGASYTNATTATLSVTGITTAGSSQYRCYITNCSGGNNATSAAANLTVNALPIPKLTSSDADNIFCAGTSVVFTAGGGTSYNFRVGGVSVQSGPSATFTPNSLTNGQVVDVIVTNANGCSATSTGITNTVNPLPIPTLTSSAPGNVFCLGTSVTFTAGGGTSYNFREGGVSVQNGPSPTYTTTTLTNGKLVDVIVTNSSGCTATSTPPLTCIVNPLPFIFVSTPATCSTDLTTYSLAVTVSTGTVTSTSGTVTNTGNNVWTINRVPKVTNITIKVTDSGGCENTIVVTAPDCSCPVVLPPVSGGDKSYCATGIIPTITVTVLAGETVDWYNSSSGGTLLSSGSLTYTPKAPGTFYAQARNTTTNCVSSSRTPITVTMNPLPVPTLTSSDANNIFCAGTSVIFTAGGGTSYNFRVGGVSVQSGVSTTYSTNSLTNGQVVDVIVTNANGCTATSAGITNTVNALPIPSLTSSDADNIFCVGTSIVFTAGGGTSYNFRVGGVSVQNGASATYTTTSLTNGQVVDVIVTNANGCTATSAGITNTVNAMPTANAGTGGNNCGLEFHLNGSLNVGTGTWSKVSGPGDATFSPDANTANALVTVTDYGIYTFRWSVVNGACSSSANVTINFIQQPPANAGSGGDICDKNFILNALLTTGTGTWTKIDGPGNAVFTPDNHQPDAKVTVDQFGTYNFEWAAVNSTCTSTGIVKVIFHDLPAINAGKDTTICKGGSIQLNAQGTGSFSWLPAVLVSSPNIKDPVATPDTTTTFTVNLTDQFGCKNSDNMVVQVRDKLVADAGPDQVLEYIFETTMDAVLINSYETGVWSVISGTGEFLDSTYTKTSVKGLSLGENKFLWTVKNGFCQASHDTTMITVNDFIIPTLITPNMDGKNDYFVIRGLAALGKTELMIFDRRGAEVYKNMNYDNSWNGVDYNKHPLPDDTYFFVLKPANNKSIGGYIVIRR